MTILKYLKIILINIFFFFIFLIFIDLLFGTWFKNDFSYRLSSERNIYRVYKFNFSNYSGQSIYVRDQNGFRVKNQGIIPQNINVVFTGGSTTNQKFLNFDNTIVSNLDNDFKNLNFANAGVDGLSIKGHINSFKYWFNKIENLKPDYYIFYLGINDMSLLKNNTKSIDEFKESDLSGNIREFLESNSFFYKKFRFLKAYLYLNFNIEKGANIINKKGIVYGERNNKKFIKYEEIKLNNHFYLEYSKIYKNLLNQLTKIVRENNSEPIYITQISGHGMNQELISAANSIIEHCEEFNLRCINLAKQLDLEYNDFFDALHLNPAGSKKVADFLVKKLNKIF